MTPPVPDSVEMRFGDRANQFRAVPASKGTARAFRLRDERGRRPGGAEQADAVDGSRFAPDGTRLEGAAAGDLTTV